MGLQSSHSASTLSHAQGATNAAITSRGSAIAPSVSPGLQSSHGRRSVLILLWQTAPNIAPNYIYYFCDHVSILSTNSSDTVNVHRVNSGGSNDSQAPCSSRVASNNSQAVS